MDSKCYLTKGGFNKIILKVYIYIYTDRLFNMDNIFTSSKNDSIYFAQNDRTVIYTPLLSIGCDLQQPTKNH